MIPQDDVLLRFSQAYTHLSTAKNIFQAGRRVKTNNQRGSVAISEEVSSTLAEITQEEETKVEIQ